jgi:predicted NodU family carbamoyl transferase
MKILGLNAYHGDSAACLFVDGKLIAAAEEERFRRIKHWAGLPTSAINYVLEEGKLSLGEIDHIAINRKSGVNNLRRLGFALTHWPHPKVLNTSFNENEPLVCYPDYFLRTQMDLLVLGNFFLERKGQLSG